MFTIAIFAWVLLISLTIFAEAIIINKNKQIKDLHQIIKELEDN